MACEIMEKYKQEASEKARREELNLIIESVKRLRNGETPEQLLASGIEQGTIDCAVSILAII